MAWVYCEKFQLKKSLIRTKKPVRIRIDTRYLETENGFVGICSNGWR